jgi:predicted metal-binding protein
MTNREKMQQKVDALIECNRMISASTIADILSDYLHGDLQRSDRYYEAALEMKTIALAKL